MLIRHSAIYLLGRLIPGVVSLLALALFTRILNAGQYGLYALVIAAAAAVNAVFFQWLNLSLGRFLQAHDHEPGNLLSTALTGFVILVFATAILGGAAAWLWPERALRWFVILTVLIVWAQAWYDLNLKILNARLDPARYGLITSVKALLAVGIGLALFYLGLGVAGVILGLVLGLLLPCLFVLKHWRGLSIRAVDARLLRVFIGYGAPLTVTFALTMVLDSSDRFLLGWYANAETVGIYAAAYVLAQQSLGMLMSTVHLAAFPLAVQALEEKGVSEARIQLRKNLLMLLAIAVPAATGLVMLANNIAAVVLGHSFQAGARPIIVIIAMAILAGGIKSFYIDTSFQLARRMTGLAWVAMWAALINVALNVCWIPRHGGLGAAYATLAAFLAGALLSWRLGRGVFRLPAPPIDSYKLFLASLGMAACLWPTLTWHGVTALAAQIFLGVAVYTLLLLIGDFGRLQLRLRLHFETFRKRRQPVIST